MNEIERNQIKGALLKCAEENEGKGTFTGYVVVSSICKSAVERIEELEQENTRLKLELEALDGQIPWKDIKGKSEVLGKLTKAKGLLRAWFQYCIDTEGKTPLQIETAQFLSEVEK